MSFLVNIGIVLATFVFMEGVAWFTHKYVMHGLLWILHRDHHQPHQGWFERNDAFFLFYAAVSIFFIYLWDQHSFYYGLAIGLGILTYGIAYFVVHDIFIHQRFKWLRNIDNFYARGVRRAHKIHHKHLGKEDSENFGMLFVPFKYFKRNN